MYTCPNEDLFCAFVDNEVPPLLKKELEEHALKCKKCRQVVDRFKFLKTALVYDEKLVLDLDKSFEKLLLKRNSRKKRPYSVFFVGTNYKVVASAVAGIFLFVFSFVLLRHNSGYDKAYTLHKGEVHFTPIVPMSYRQHNVLTNIDLHDMTSVIKTNKRQTNISYRNLTNTFNNFTYLYAPLEDDLNDSAITMPNANKNIFYNYGVKMPIYTKLNKNVK